MPDLVRQLRAVEKLTKADSLLRILLRSQLFDPLQTF